MGVEIKTMEWTVWNYLFEKINYKAKVHFFSPSSNSPSPSLFLAAGRCSGQCWQWHQIQSKGLEPPHEQQMELLLWGQGG
jgi:hypothetical protein